ncbi:hypothetical protein ABE67_19830 [Cytobacillus firmus]|uniref:hypothetical protein n=1 Tax=Cytobacillus firmus TaxID=1399 RepID=UPI0018CEA4DF|nr:hypothetical protein [Cytobacillus firmus]MBG9451462.1 hypothetical protein [Cytobacillus firmus]
MSQKLEQLRTQEAEIAGSESEPGATSGHRKQKSQDLIPNPEQLRTQEAEIAGSESEPGATSDRESRKPEI